MRVNEYTSLDEFKAQYIGVWDPSENHWLGLDFSYDGAEYRLNTGSMYETKNTILPDGREAIFGLYRKNTDNGLGPDYSLLEEFATLDEVLNSKCINGISFKQIIMDDSTELLGQD